MIDRAHLRQLAEAATKRWPHPWFREQGNPNWYVGSEPMASKGELGSSIAETIPPAEDGDISSAYIAAAHPGVMIELLDEIDQHVVGATNNRNRYRQEIEAVSDERDAAVARAESAERELAKRETRG